MAARLLPLIFAARFGTYHVGGPEPASWFDVLTRAKVLGGLSGAVVTQTAAELALPAVRPAYSALTSVFTPNIGLEPLPSLDDAIARFVAASA